MKVFNKSEQLNGVSGWWNSEHIIKWDKQYDEYDGHTVRYLISRQKVMLKMLDALSLPKGSRVLELGYGAGQTAASFVERGYDVIGYDISERLCEIAKKKCAQKGPDSKFDLRVGSIESKLDLADDSVDVVVQMGALQYLYDPHECLKEAYRVLKPGGYFICGQRNAYCISHLTSFRESVRNLFYFILREKNELEKSFHYMIMESKLGRYFKKYEKTKWFNSRFMLKGHTELKYKMKKNLYTAGILKKALNTNGFKIIDLKGAYFPFSENKQFWNFNLKYDDFLTSVSHIFLFHFINYMARTIVILTQKDDKELRIN